jgi:hypothetical protein
VGRYWGQRFVKVLACYALISDTELGFNAFIERDGNNKYFAVPRDVCHCGVRPEFAELLLGGVDCYTYGLDLTLEGQ